MPRIAGSEQVTSLVPRNPRWRGRRRNRAQGPAFLLLFLPLLLLPPPSAAAEPGPKPWDHLGENMVRSLFGWPLFLHAAGGLSTWVLLDQGWDAAAYRMAARQDPLANALVWSPGMLAGTFAPLALPASLYFFSADEDRVRAGAASLQAVTVAFFYNNLLKAVTGRLPPDSDHPDPESQADGFQFGFLRGGLFNGWPSGHMMTNSALAAAFASYSGNKGLGLSALAYSLYIGACVTFGARGDIHWISDAVAGGLMGLGVGWTVGRRFARARDGAGEGMGLAFVPVIGERIGLRAVIRGP